MFVDRQRELRLLERARKRVEEGLGRFVIVEGPAGIGKSALIRRFLEGMDDDSWNIVKAQARFEQQHVPYWVFTEAFGIESVEDLQEEITRHVADRIIGEISSRSSSRIFVDEPRPGVTRAIDEKIPGSLVISPMRPGGVFLTELDVKGGVNPHLLDSEVLDRVIAYARSTERPVVIIENINYLFRITGARSVEYFLRDVASILKNGHLVASGDLDSLGEEERKIIDAVFQLSYSLELHAPTGNTVVFTPKPPRDSGVVVFSDRGDGDYLVSESGELRPSMPRFMLLERVLDSLTRGDVVLSCMRSLIDYTDLMEVYSWLKYVRDVAILRGRRIYVDTRTLTAAEVRILGELADRVIAPGEGESKYAIYDAFLGHIQNLARERNLCIVMEDLQWCDSNSMDLLRYMARTLPRGTLFIITYRGEAIALTERAKIISEMRDYEGTEFIRLGPLGREDSLALLEELNVENAEEIYERSGGNPLLMMEMAKYAGKDSAIPDTIMESIEMRMAALDDTTLYVLRFLSTMGSEIPREDVDALLGEGWADELRGWEDIIEIGEKVKFRNTLMWEYLYRSTPPDLRREFHERIGKYYEPKSIFMAAHHYHAAMSRKAIDYLVRAAEKSREMYALENAMEFYRMALEIADKYRMDDIRAELLEKLADMEELTGRYKDAIRHYKELLRINDSPRILWKIARCLNGMGEHDLAEGYLRRVMERGDEEIKKKALETWGNLYVRKGNFEEAEKYLREFLRIAEEEGNEEDLSHAYSSLATLHFHRSQYREALEYAKKAMEYAQRTGEYQQLIAVYNLLGVVYDVIGQPQKALEKYQTLYDLAKKAGDLRGMAMAYNNMGILYYTIGDINKVKEYLEKAMDLHLKMGDLRSLALSYYNLSGVYSDLGDYARGKEYALKAKKLYEKLGDRRHSAFSELWIGLYDMWMGNYEEAMHHVHLAIEEARKQNYVKLLFMATVTRARIFLRMGESSLALEEMRKLEPLLERMRNDADAYPEYLQTMCEIHLELGNIGDAMKYIDELGEIAERIQNEYMKGLHLVLRAIAKALSGEESEEEFLRGLELIRRQGSVTMVAEAYLDYGKALMKIGGGEYRRYLREAREMFKRMNLDARVREIDDICGDC